MRFVENPGVLEKVEQRETQPEGKPYHQRVRNTEKEGREGERESLGTEVAAFVFASYQDRRFRALSGIEN